MQQSADLRLLRQQGLTVRRGLRAHVQAHLDRVDFDGTDLPAYAGRLFDIFEDDPAVIRLASWYRLERSNGPGLPAVISANQARLESWPSSKRRQIDGSMGT